MQKYSLKDLDLRLSLLEEEGNKSGRRVNYCPVVTGGSSGACKGRTGGLRSAASLAAGKEKMTEKLFWAHSVAKMLRVGTTTLLASLVLAVSILYHTGLQVSCHLGLAC